MDDAQRLSEVIINAKVAACVDFWPISSAYNWEGSIKKINQAMLLITTFESKLDQVNQMVGENHSYSVPLIAGVDVRRINHSYKEWMMENIQ